MIMKHSALIIHLLALAVLFATLSQPYALEKPAGVRRAVETVAKKGRIQIVIKFSASAIAAETGH